MPGELFEQLDFEPNAQFEKIISDVMDHRYSVVPDFLSPLETDSLREVLFQKFNDDAFKKAAIGNRFNEKEITSVRGDFISWIDQGKACGAERTFLSRVDALIAYLNRTCFLGIVQKEFHYAVYPEGSRYRRHLDVFRNDDRRLLSLICYLNERDWRVQDGGELILYLPGVGEETEKVAHPMPGQLVILQSQEVEHEVRPALRNRMSLTGWLKTR
ncbi:MAG: 2OG-Fe(II) oxygenase [Robiginitalea sp.]